MTRKRWLANVGIVLGVVALISIARLGGTLRDQRTMMNKLTEHYPQAHYHLERKGSNSWYLLSQQADTLGVLRLGEGKGYNGPVGVLVHISTEGMIRDVVVLYHSETPSYFEKLYRNKYPDQLMAMNTAQWMAQDFPDGVTGATISSNALLMGVCDALDILPNHSERKGILKSGLGFKEVVILLMLAIALWLPQIRPRGIQRVVYHLLLFTSLFYLGFWEGEMLGFSRMVALVSGYLPGLYHQLGFLILLAGSILLFFVSGRNVYCRNMCPFGSAQELLGKIGGAKPVRPAFRKKWKWIQWGVALMAACAALYWGDPSLAQYEVFGVFFQLTGNSIMFVLLFITVIGSLFIVRPWCRLLCPIDGFFSLLRAARKGFTMKH